MKLLTAIFLSLSFNAISSVDKIHEDDAQCMMKNKVYLYVTDSCGACKEQKKVFTPEAWEIYRQNHINCSLDENEEKCDSIRCVPTWEKGDERVCNYKTPAQIRDFSGC